VVGRAVEGTFLTAAMQAAAQGEPQAVFVHGEAGVGKTSLVREVLGSFAGEVLWGTCVHFGAASVPFAALISALDRWVAAVDPPVRDEVFAGLDALHALLPSLGAGAVDDRGLVLPQIDSALVRLARRRPTVLVIDDLQWADASSLDLLAFLISGFRDQQLAVVATVRDEDRPESHRLTSWLAEVRRMPSVEEMHLERLGAEGTAAQVAAGARRVSQLRPIGVPCSVFCSTIDLLSLATCSCRCGRRGTADGASPWRVLVRRSYHRTWSTLADAETHGSLLGRVRTQWSASTDSCSGKRRPKRSRKPTLRQ
jgi:hypothetical protein